MTRRPAGSLAGHRSADCGPQRRQVHVTGTVDVTFADDDIANPSIGDFLRVGDSGTIEVQLELQRR